MNEQRKIKLEVLKSKVLTVIQEELNSGDIEAIDILALMAHTTGVCMALQDQRKVTVQMAMDLKAHVTNSF